MKRWAIAMLVCAVTLGCDDRSKGRARVDTDDEPPRSAKSDVDATPCESDASCRERCESCAERCKPADAVACYEDGRRRLKAMPPAFDLEGAAKSFERACESGYAYACNSLGLQVQDGRGVERSVERAIDLYGRACDRGYGIGCYNLALWYRSGRAGADGEERAKPWAERAIASYREECSGSKPRYCANLALLLETGIETTKDLAAAEAAYRRGCDGGDQVACTYFSEFELAQGRDTQPAVARTQRACELGTPEACGVLGDRYADGRPPFSRDLTRALDHWKKGCEGGFAGSCQRLGGELAKVGEAGRTVYTAALERACSLGASASCRFLGLDADERDAAAALPYWTRACNIGEPDACTYLGVAYRSGRGATMDAKRAMEHFEDACHLDSYPACAEVARAGRSLGLSAQREAKFRDAAARNGISLSPTK